MLEQPQGSLCTAGFERQGSLVTGCSLTAPSPSVPAGSSYWYPASSPDPAKSGDRNGRAGLAGTPDCTLRAVASSPPGSSPCAPPPTLPEAPRLRSAQAHRLSLPHQTQGQPGSLGVLPADALVTSLSRRPHFFGAVPQGQRLSSSLVMPPRPSGDPALLVSRWSLSGHQVSLFRVPPRCGQLDGGRPSSGPTVSLGDVQPRPHCGFRSSSR